MAGEVQPLFQQISRKKQKTELTLQKEEVSIETRRRIFYLEFYGSVNTVNPL